MGGAEQPASWHDWHSAYDDEGSSLSARLEVVQRRLIEALDALPEGPARLISACAGQGRDVVPVLERHRRGQDVCALLVELDRQNADAARRAAREARLPLVTVREADAGHASVYADAVPADVLLFCGVFGNISDEDIATTIEALSGLCAPSATVIWTRGRTEPDLTPTIRRWFSDCGFVELGFDGEPGSFGVGAHRLADEPAVFDGRRKLFAFLPLEELSRRRRPGRHSSYAETVTAPYDADETNVA